MSGPGLQRRHLMPAVSEALETFRVVVLHGPRQAGKTTLVRQLVGDGTFLPLDDEALFRAACEDPAGLIGGRSPPIVIDEVQRAGDPLVRAIKLAVDQDPTPGRFLLTRSADFLTVPTISESLAGRAAIFTLFPFSQGEIHGRPESFLERLVHDHASLGRSGPVSQVEPGEYEHRICAGGYPEVMNMGRRAMLRWFDAYVRTIAARDVVELTGARRAAQLPQLLRAVAARTANELVVSKVHGQVGLGSVQTTADYLSHLEMIHLIETVPAWSVNLTARVKRHPKVHLIDTGLAAALLAKTPEMLTWPTDPARGPLFETFAVNELLRQASWLDIPVGFHHYRDRHGREIDLICELPDGRVAAVEVKAAATVSAKDAAHLVWLRERLGSRFGYGVVLYTGPHPLPLGDRIAALPLSCLWTLEPLEQGAETRSVTPAREAPETGTARGTRHRSGSGRA